MVRSERMKPAVEVAKSREDDAARCMGEHRQRLSAQEKRLEELSVYRAEYALRFERSAGQGMGAMQALEFRQFLARLNQAIAEQERTVVLLRNELAQRTQHWREANTRTRALDKVVERLEGEEARAERRIEQRDADEVALRRHRNGDGG